MNTTKVPRSNRGRRATANERGQAQIHVPSASPAFAYQICTILLINKMLGGALNMKSMRDTRRDSHDRPYEYRHALCSPLPCAFSCMSRHPRKDRANVGEIICVPEAYPQAPQRECVHGEK